MTQAALTAEQRVPCKVEASLGEDRTFRAEVGPGATIEDLAKAWDASRAEMRQFIDDGWDVLVPPTIESTPHGAKCETTLTRRPTPLTLSEAYTKVMRQGEVAAAEVQAEREELVQATLTGGAE